MEYISREWVKELLREIQREYLLNYEQDKFLGVLAALDVINEAPAHNVRPIVRGRWIPHTIYGADNCSDTIGLVGYKCSVCGRFESEKEPFCNCGARMDGDE